MRQVQLAGHKDGFKISESSSWIGKKGNKYEKVRSQWRAFYRPTSRQLALKELMEDPLKPFVPEFGGVELENGVEFLQLSNLLARFDTPNIMDCKVGCR